MKQQINTNQRKKDLNPKQSKKRLIVIGKLVNNFLSSSILFVSLVIIIAFMMNWPVQTESQTSVLITENSQVAPVVVTPTITPTKASITLSSQSLEASSVEEVSTGPYYNMVWSPVEAKALITKNFVQHVVVRMERSRYETPIGDLWLLNSETNQEDKLIEGVNGYIWSPDGTKIAYLTPLEDEGIEAGLYVMDVETGDTNQVAQADFLLNYWKPQWLPTDEIVYVHNGQLWSVRPDGTEQKALPFKFHNWIAVEAGKPNPVDDSPIITRYRFSPTGERLVYLTPNELPDIISSQLWLANADGTAPQHITKQAEGSYYDWSPDGQWLVFNTFRDVESQILDTHLPPARGLWLIKTDGSNLRSLAQVDQWGLFLSPTWAPDSSMVAFIEEQPVVDDQVDAFESRIHIANVDTGNLTASSELGAVGSPVLLWWSTDGNSLFTYQTDNASQNIKLNTE